MWIAGGLAEPERRLWFWLAALAVEYASPALNFFVPGLGRSRTEDWNIEGGHMAERVGLFFIICLGETLLISGATFGGLDWTSGEVWAAFVSAVLSTVAMWRLFFSQAHESASHAIMHASDPGRIARRAYELYVERGCGDGQADDDWCRAEREIRHGGGGSRTQS